MNTDPIFEPGDKVVCVDDSPAPSPERTHTLRKGIVYCVDHMVPNPYWATLGVKMIGYPFSLIHGGKPIGWRSSRFRKVSEVGHPAIAMVNEEVRT